MLDRLIARWQGTALALIGIVATMWLAATDRLGLYIHPRYFWFAVVMAVIAAVLAVAAFALVPAVSSDGLTGEHDEHDEHREPGEPGEEAAHRQHSAPSRLGRLGRLGSVLSALLIVAAAGALLVLPPTTLTSATAEQRSINSSGATGVGQQPPTLVGADTSQFTVKDWALFLQQDPGADYFADQQVDVTGFVMASPDDPENVFYVSRFAVTCCAVDAQPVGVPVHLPGWAEQFSSDEWVSVTGVFRSAADSSSPHPLLLAPDDVAVVDEPEQPYVF